MSRRQAPWFLLLALICLALVLRVVAAAGQQPAPVDTVVAKVVGTPSAPTDTSISRRVGDEPDVWVRRATIITPILLAVIGFLGTLLAYLTRRAELAAQTAASVAKASAEHALQVERKQGKSLGHITRLVNDQSDDQNRRIDELTEALTARKIPVPPRLTAAKAEFRQAKGKPKMKRSRAE